MTCLNFINLLVNKMKAVSKNRSVKIVMFKDCDVYSVKILLLLLSQCLISSKNPK